MTFFNNENKSTALTIDTIYSIPQRKVLTTALWVSAFTILTAVGAQVTIPTLPVPITLQTFFVILSGAFLGARKGAASQFAYLVSGAVGLPVFASGSGSILHLFGPTGGYLLAFPIASFIVGYVIHDIQFMKRLPRLFVSLLAMCLGMITIFLFGVAQLYVTLIHHWQTAVQTGFISMQWWDGLKLIAAASIYSEIARRYAKVD